MASFKCLLYLNLIIGTINVLLLIEVIYQAVENSCTKLEYKINDGKIVAAQANVIDRYPYIAALLASEDIEDDKYDFVCATVIVSVFHSLTACHCIDSLKEYNAKTIKVRSGSMFWQEGGTLRDVIKIVKNEHFNRHYFDNDIAIISVKPTFHKTEIIAVAGMDYNLQDGSPINVTGWGVDPAKSHPVNTTVANTLYTVTVNTINIKICARMVNEYLSKADPDVSYHNKLDNTQFCAETFENGKGGCVYDFGGPAVQNNVLVGIVSAGASVCGRKEYPGIYTNLGNLYGWLLMH